MSDIEARIREEAKKVLESGEVSVVIGWGAGSVVFKTTPVFVEKPEDADALVWNPACVNNLAVYLPKMAKDKKVGIVAKPCDIRSIIALIQERQLKRENVFIIGLGCHGVVDAQNLDDWDFHLQEVTAIEWTSDGLKVSTEDTAYTVKRSDCLRDMCQVCTKRAPAIYDVVLGDALEPDAGVAWLCRSFLRRGANTGASSSRNVSGATPAGRFAQAATAAVVSPTAPTPGGRRRRRPLTRHGCFTRPGRCILRAGVSAAASANAFARWTSP